MKIKKLLTSFAFIGAFSIVTPVILTSCYDENPIIPPFQQPEKNPYADTDKTYEVTTTLDTKTELIDYKSIWDEMGLKAYDSETFGIGDLANSTVYTSSEEVYFNSASDEYKLFNGYKEMSYVDGELPDNNIPNPDEYIKKSMYSPGTLGNFTYYNGSFEKLNETINSGLYTSSFTNASYTNQEYNRMGNKLFESLFQKNDSFYITKPSKLFDVEIIGSDSSYTDIAEVSKNTILDDIYENWADNAKTSPIISNSITKSLINNAHFGVEFNSYETLKETITNNGYNSEVKPGKYNYYKNWNNKKLEITYKNVAVLNFYKIDDGYKMYSKLDFKNDSDYYPLNYANRFHFGSDDNNSGKYNVLTLYMFTTDTDIESTVVSTNN